MIFNLLKEEKLLNIFFNVFPRTGKNRLISWLTFIKQSTQCYKPLPDRYTCKVLNFCFLFNSHAKFGSIPLPKFLRTLLFVIGVFISLALYLIIFKGFRGLFLSVFNLREI